MAPTPAVTAPLPNPNRNITDNDSNGQSYFSAAIPPELPITKEIGGALFRLAYLAGTPPDTLTNQADLENYKTCLSSPPELVPTGGKPIMWYVDTPPSAVSPWHRTLSIDFVVQLEGEIELAMESGERRVLKPGDVTVQRSTMHAWRNLSSTKWSRMLAVMTECRPVEVEGQKLGLEFR